MDSCFPPLAALRIRDSSSDASGMGLARNRLSGGHKAFESLDSSGSAPGILQDLDLYYIRQIAHNLKVQVVGEGFFCFGVHCEKLYSSCREAFLTCVHFFNFTSIENF